MKNFYHRLFFPFLFSSSLHSLLCLLNFLFFFSSLKDFFLFSLEDFSTITHLMMSLNKTPDHQQQRHWDENILPRTYFDTLRTCRESWKYFGKYDDNKIPFSLIVLCFFLFVFVLRMLNYINSTELWIQFTQNLNFNFLFFPLHKLISFYSFLHRHTLSGACTHTLSNSVSGAQVKRKIYMMMIKRYCDFSQKKRWKFSKHESAKAIWYFNWNVQKWVDLEFKINLTNDLLSIFLQRIFSFTKITQSAKSGAQNYPTNCTTRMEV